MGAPSSGLKSGLGRQEANNVMTPPAANVTENATAEARSFFIITSQQQANARPSAAARDQHSRGLSFLSRFFFFILCLSIIYLTFRNRDKLLCEFFKARIFVRWWLGGFTLFHL